MMYFNVFNSKHEKSCKDQSTITNVSINITDIQNTNVSTL
jgi:hypothetical protein